MKCIYILYSDKINEAYFGSTSLELKRRLCFHKNDNRRNFNLTCCNILDSKDYNIEELMTFNTITRASLEKIESGLIKKYQNNNFTYNNKSYKIVNKVIPFQNDRFLCTCGCEKELVQTTINKHLKNKEK